MPAIPPGPIVVDASALAPDASTIDLLARLQLSAARIGRRLLLRSVPADLERLIDFAGLADVLGIEPRRQAEQREEPCRVEEERQLDDPAF